MIFQDMNEFEIKNIYFSSPEIMQPSPPRTPENNMFSVDNHIVSSNVQVHQVCSILLIIFHYI